MKMTLGLAMRNLMRNRWRSGLALGGIAVATAMLIWNLGFMNGFFEMMVRGTTDVEIGHVQIQDRDYVEQPATIDYFDWAPELVDTIAGVEEVEGVTPRVRLFGLIGHEDRSHIGRIMGVDPATEPDVTVMHEGVRQGRWLSEQMPESGPAEVVIGNGLGRTLGVGIGDELVVIAEGADGSMGDGLLEVVGILNTGNSRIDRQAALLHLEEAQFIAAMDGAVHEAVIAIANPPRAPQVSANIQRALDAGGHQALQARPWQEVEPGIYEMLLYGDQANQVIFLIIFFVVALGVLNALRMSARERYREFGVMMAVGLSRVRLFSMIIVEGLVLGIIGAGLGGIIGGAITWYHTVFGIDFGAFIEGDATYMGVSFSERVYFAMDLGTIMTPVVGLIIVAVVCAIWPAIAAIRLNARDAISGRT